MVHKPIAIMILPIFVAGILMLGILAATTNAQENNSTGNEQQQNNSTGNEQASSSTGNGQASSSTGNGQASSSTGNGQASSSTGNRQASSNAETTQVNNSTGTTQVNNSTGNESADFANSILVVHNRERDAVGVPSLVWSKKLAADAKPWAEHLATLGEITQQNAHDPNRNGEGENVHLGNPAYRAITSVEEMLNGWVSEKKDYHSEGQALHYTQMVWRTTKEVGCAIASPSGNGKWDVLVCRYSPAGNSGGPAY